MIATKQVLILPAALLTVVLAGCAGDSYDAYMTDTLAAFKELNGVMDGVTDDATAQAAVPRLEAVTKQMQAIGKRLEELFAREGEEKSGQLLAAAIEADATRAKEWKEVKSRIDANLSRLEGNSAVKRNAPFESALNNALGAMEDID